MNPRIIAINLNARSADDWYAIGWVQAFRLRGDIGDAPFNAIAINPDAVFGEIRIDIAGVEFRCDAGAGGRKAECGTRAKDKNIIQENAINLAENQGILISLLPG